jgi:hypothetical protein
MNQIGSQSVQFMPVSRINLDGHSNPSNPVIISIILEVFKVHRFYFS